MRLSSPDTVLIPKFGVLIPKTVTCRSWTHTQTDRITRAGMCIDVTGQYIMCSVITVYTPYIVRTCHMLQNYYQNRFAIAYGNRYAIWKNGL